jgi:hypothetical protein
MNPYYPDEPRTGPPSRGVPAVVDEILALAPELRDRLGFGYASDRASVAHDRHCPPEMLTLLARDTPTVVLEAAGNPGCPPGTLAAIIDRLEATAGSSDHWIVVHTYRAVLGNPSCPEDILRRMFHREIETILENPSCPVDLISAASRSEDWRDRRLALRNRALPAADLLALVCDGHPTVAWIARTRSMDRDAATVREALLTVSAHSRHWMVERLDRRQIRRLARDADPRLRRLAARVTTDRGLLSRLAGDADGHVRRQASERVMALLAA